MHCSVCVLDPMHCSVYVHSYVLIPMHCTVHVLVPMGCTSSLLVKVLACNRKVAGSSPTRCRLFSPMSILSSTLKMRVFVTASFREDVKPSVPGSWLILATCAIPASSLATFGKTLVEKKFYI